jgi:hypothetical protein
MSIAWAVAVIGSNHWTPITPITAVTLTMVVTMNSRFGYRVIGEGWTVGR